MNGAALASLAPGIASATRSECAAVLALVSARLLELGEAPAPAADDVLDVHAAAKLIGISPLTLSHKRKLPPYAALVVPTGSRVVRFSRARIEAWKASAAGAPDAPPVRSPKASPRSRRSPDWLGGGRGSRSS